MKQGELSHYCDFGCLAELMVIEHALIITAVAPPYNCPKTLTTASSSLIHHFGTQSSAPLAAIFVPLCHCAKDSIGFHGCSFVLTLRREMHAMTPTELQISQQYGAPLIPLTAVASILGRSPSSLRVLINQGRGDQALATKLRACRARLGRRTMFRVSDIARLIDEA